MHNGYYYMWVIRHKSMNAKGSAMDYLFAEPMDIDGHDIYFENHTFEIKIVIFDIDFYHFDLNDSDLKSIYTKMILILIR